MIDVKIDGNSDAKRHWNALGDALTLFCFVLTLGLNGIRSGYDWFV
jgi:hypothetical protein